MCSIVVFFLILHYYSTYQPLDVTVQWLQNDNPTDEGKKSLKRQANKVEKDFFRCNVSNRVSSMISDAVKQECIKSSEYDQVVTAIWDVCLTLFTQVD